MNAEWARLEGFLTAMKPGDAVSVEVLAAESGLPPDIVSRILSELARIELFAQQDERLYVRRSLWP